MKQATFLWKNERGIYFFRARVPKQLAEYFQRSEIKKSLQTDSYRLAVKLARVYRVELDKEMTKLKGPYSASQTTFSGKVKARLPDGSEELVEGEIHRDIASPDEATAHKEYLLRQLREEAERKEKQAREQALFQAQLAAIKSPTVAASIQPSEQREVASPLYSEIVKLYLDEGDAANRWRPKSKYQVESSLRLFQDFVGDLPINTIDKKITREFKSQYLKMPSNLNKKAEYRGKTVAELLDTSIPKEDLIDSSTVLNNMTRIGALFSWAKDHDYIKSNPFEGIKPKKSKRKAAEQRGIFTQSDLVSIFESSEYKTGFLHGDNRYKYWVPIIALYTGMRLEDICRIRVDWVNTVDDIWTIEIKPDEEWYGKTDAALRSFAIHPKLIELGFLDLVNTQQNKGKLRLFDELVKSRDGYGARVSKWFARYYDRCGVIDKKKTFHSLRHTFLNELKQRSVPLEIRESIAGHENRSQSESRYGKAYIAQITFDSIQKADYELSHPKFNIKLD